MVIDGKKIASEIIENLKKRGAPKKFLAAFLIGSDPASESFIKQKEKISKELEIDFRLYKFPESVSEVELKLKISDVSKDKSCGGLILQLPLPAGIRKENIISAIPPEKDVDALNGDIVLSPAVGVVEEILKATRYKIKETRAAVVGLGFLVGKPISEWLKGKCAEIYLLDIGSDFSVLKRADLVILGTGQAGLIKPEMLKDDALVIDFGYGTADGKVCGDFDVSGLQVTSYKLRDISHTPTPGGTGPILVAKLFENFFKLATL